MVDTIQLQCMVSNAARPRKVEVKSGCHMTRETCSLFVCEPNACALFCLWSQFRKLRMDERIVCHVIQAQTENGGNAGELLSPPPPRGCRALPHQRYPPSAHRHSDDKLKLSLQKKDVGKIR